MAKRSSAKIQTALKNAKKEIKAISDRASTPRAHANSRLEKLLLYLDTHGGLVKPRVEVIESTNVVVEDLEAAADLNRQLTGGKRCPPPYVKAQSPPTWQQCAELHFLNNEQTLAFYIVARTLLEEKAGSNPPQLKMAISGQVSRCSQVCFASV